MRLIGAVLQDHGALVQAGNILLFVRISRNNRMLPFSSQTMNLVNNFMENRPPGKSNQVALSEHSFKMSVIRVT